MTQTYADDQDLAVGERLSIQTASGDKRTVVVRGIYDPPEIEQMLGAITIGQQAFDEVFPQPKNRFTFLDAGAGRKPGADRGRGRLQRRQGAHRRRLRRTTTRRASPAS